MDQQLSNPKLKVQQNCVSNSDEATIKKKQHKDLRVKTKVLHYSIQLILCQQKFSSLTTVVCNTM